MIKDFSIKSVVSGNATRAIVYRRSKSSPVTPQRESNLCRASSRDFSPEASGSKWQKMSIKTF